MVTLDKFTNTDFASLKQWIKSEKELIQFAGTIFNYPLTDSQLENYLKQKDLEPFKIKLNTTGEIIGHCELNFSNDNSRLSRILIGKSDLRGKGIGKIIITEMLKLIEKQKPNSIFISTLFYNNNEKNWHYLHPDSGMHIFFYSKKSLKMIAKKYDYNVCFFDNQYALFYKEGSS